jgi:PTH1 family peptidyl-tRNA hydrolase
MILLVGLGNPGPKFAKNRHNIGFMAVDEIVRRHGLSAWRSKFQGEVAEGLIAGEKVVALKPMTYMNESGQSVGKAMRFYNLTSQDVVVVYDELDLPPGKLRMKTGGGLAGHNGLKSIKAHIGDQFHRIRLGIGHPGHKDKVHSYVLKDFARADADWLDPLLEAIAGQAPLLATRQFATFQNKVHLDLNPEPAPAKAKPAQRPAPASSPADNDKDKQPSGPFAALKRIIGGNESDN